MLFGQPRLLVKKGEAFKKVGNLYAACKPGWEPICSAELTRPTFRPSHRCQDGDDVQGRRGLGDWPAWGQTHARRGSAQFLSCWTYVRVMCRRGPPRSPNHFLAVGREPKNPVRCRVFWPQDQWSWKTKAIMTFRGMGQHWNADWSKPLILSKPGNQFVEFGRAALSGFWCPRRGRLWVEAKRQRPTSAKLTKSGIEDGLKATGGPKVWV